MGFDPEEFDRDRMLNTAPDLVDIENYFIEGKEVRIYRCQWNGKEVAISKSVGPFENPLLHFKTEAETCYVSRPRCTIYGDEKYNNVKKRWMRDVFENKF